jgi:FkbM family methyltransferase
MIAQLPGFKMIVETDIEKYRADTFLTKEPETLAWIDDMDPGEALYDVGANVGVYSLYAASRGVNVVAFEPVLENYVRLVQNIELNGLVNVVPIYGACATFGQMIIPMAIKSKIIGESGSQLISSDGFKPECIRQVPCYALDDRYLPNFPPQHIKVDIDGKEAAVIAGFFKLFILGNKLKSFLVEFNYGSDGFESIFDLVGFSSDNKYNAMIPHSRERRQKEGIDAENVVFTRK